jgi:hypothetical protein
MRQFCILLISFFISFSIRAQEASDLFVSSDTKISWLGVDYSHVKLIGSFAQFFNSGDKSVNQLKDEYFLGWNNLVLNEPNKYDIKGMLRKSNLYIDVDMIMKINSDANLEDIESYNVPNYSTTFIDSIVSQYPVQGKSGIGILFIAEALNKPGEEAFYHFVAMNMETNQVLIQERLRGEPRGFGLRNYWAGSLYDVIKQIEKQKYRLWKNTYK